MITNEVKELIAYIKSQFKDGVDDVHLSKAKLLTFLTEPIKKPICAVFSPNLTLHSTLELLKDYYPIIYQNYKKSNKYVVKIIKKETDLRGFTIDNFIDFGMSSFDREIIESRIKLNSIAHLKLTEQYPGILVILRKDLSIDDVIRILQKFYPTQYEQYLHWPETVRIISTYKLSTEAKVKIKELKSVDDILFLQSDEPRESKMDPTDFVSWNNLVSVSMKATLNSKADVKRRYLLQTTATQFFLTNDHIRFNSLV